MMRKISLILLAAAMILVAGCKKNYDTVTLSARIDNNNLDSKLYINGITPSWHNGDGVYVNDQPLTVSGANGGHASIVNVTASDSYRAFYPADMLAEGTDLTNAENGVSITLPLYQAYETDGNNKQKVRVPMSAYVENSTTLTFHNLCSLIKVKIVNNTSASVTLERITIAAENSHLSGAGTAQLTGGEHDVIQMPTERTDDGYEVALSFANTHPTIDNNGAFGEYYIIAPAFQPSGYEDDVIISINTTNGKYFRVKKESVPLPPNHIANVTITLTNNDAKDDQGFNTGDGKVKFSPGNLQYDIGENKWYFASTQYDYVGNGNVMSSGYTGRIDLFGWGTGTNPTNTSRTDSDYLDFNEWGNNTIENNTDQTAVWHTMTKAQWDYLFFTRPECSTINGFPNVRYAKAQVRGTNGLILFPDGYCWPEDITVYPQFNNETIAYANSAVYDADTWGALEASGAVFLPAAGVRITTADGSSLTGLNASGHYWTSTYDGPSDDGRRYFARTMNFNSSHVNDQNRDWLHKGFSVRLVTNVQ